MKLLDVRELEELLLEAGFSDVRVDENCEKSWICGIGRKY